MTTLNNLTSELEPITKQIYALKARIANTADETNKKNLTKELRDYQYQALFYISKIENLHRELKSKGV